MSDCEHEILSWVDNGKGTEEIGAQAKCRNCGVVMERKLIFEGFPPGPLVTRWVELPRE